MESTIWGCRRNFIELLGMYTGSECDDGVRWRIGVDVEYGMLTRDEGVGE